MEKCHEIAPPSGGLPRALEVPQKPDRVEAGTSAIPMLVASIRKMSVGKETASFTASSLEMLLR